MEWGIEMSNRLQELLERDRKTTMTPEQGEAQRQSFAYGNTKFENDRITRDTVERASKRLAQRNASRSKELRINDQKQQLR